MYTNKGHSLLYLCCTQRIMTAQDSFYLVPPCLLLYAAFLVVSPSCSSSIWSRGSFDS